MCQSDVASVVRSFFGSFGGRDPAVIAAHVSDDFVNEHVSALGRGCVGRSLYQERLPLFLDGMKQLAYEVEDLIVEGNRAVVTYTLTALWQGTEPVEIRGAQRLVVADGLITRRTDYWDSADFLRQANPAAATALKQFGI